MKALTNYLMILGVLLVTSGCTARSLEVVANTQTIDIVKPASPEPINPYNIKFRVVNADNLDSFLNDIKATNNDIVFVALSVKDYEFLAINTQELFRYIKQQKEIIAYYEIMVNE